MGQGGLAGRGAVFSATNLDTSAVLHIH